MDVKKFVETLVPLDLILIQGSSPFAKLIENGSEIMRSDGRFSHCGLVVNRAVCLDMRLDMRPDMRPDVRPDVRSDMRPDLDQNELFLMEATISVCEKTPNAITGTYSFGAQIRRMEDILSELIADGQGVAVCHLKDNPYVAATQSDDPAEIAKIQDAMSKIYKMYFAHDMTIYELNIFALLGTIFPTVRALRDRIDEWHDKANNPHPWLFCSELTCIVYRDLGLLDQSIDVQAYLPVDFTKPADGNEVFSIVEPPIFLKKIEIAQTAKCCLKCTQYVRRVHCSLM
jgi:hypothetical protein